MEHTIRSNGQSVPVSQAKTRDLESFVRWQEDRLAKGLVEDRWVASNRAQLEAAKREIAGRKNGQRAQAPAVPEESALVAYEQKTLGNAISDAAQVNALLGEANSRCHLIGGVTHIDALPEGFGVSLRLINIDIEKETYSVGAKLALSGTALSRIGAAAAIDWDPNQSTRLDDGRDPHYCHFRSVGYLRDFDGSRRSITGEADIDMREGSDQVKEIRAAAKRRATQERPNDGGESEIRQVRRFLLRHAESKAKNRAIANGLGVARSYFAEELQKPFAIARLVFTGKSDDPELRREFARMNAAAAIGGVAALYGPRKAQAPPQIAACAEDVSDDNWDGFGRYEDEASGRY